jgi:hypothetical protein
MDINGYMIHTAAVDGDIAIADATCYTTIDDMDTVAWTLRKRFMDDYPRTYAYQTITSPNGRLVMAYGTPPRAWRG